MSPKLKKPLIKDYCTPFFLDPTNENFVSFDSKGYSKAAAKYIEQTEIEINELRTALKNLLTVDDFDITHAKKVIFEAEKALRNNCSVY